MKIFPVKTISEIDKYTIEHEPILSINLMERAARKLFEYIQTNFQESASYLIFAGPGNNGGDALALARLLLLSGKDVTVVMLRNNDLSDETKINRQRLNFLEHAVVVSLDKGHPIPLPEPDTIIIDGLFGAGLNRPLEKENLELVKKINSWPNYKISIDIPSGLMGEDNFDNNYEGIICADIVLSFEFPKLSFLLPENRKFIKEWKILPIGLHKSKIEELETSWFYTQLNDVKEKIIFRDRFAYKNELGHALLIAGSTGMMGAAVLASKACMRAGVGLLTVHIPQNNEQILYTTLPEALVSIDRSSIMFTEFPDLEKFSAIAVGPGIGKKTNSKRALCDLISMVDKKPIVIDADAINILSKNNDWIEKLSENTILTPHEGEFRRLVGDWKNDVDKIEKGVGFAKKYNLITVLKGHNSVVILPNGECHFNSTGNAGMATAGCGDALTGVILSLLAQGLPPKDAAIAGVFIHGLAGDIAAKLVGIEGMITSDLIDNIGIAIKQIQ